MNANHDVDGPRAQRRRPPRSAAEGFVRIDSTDDDALARCEAAVLIGKRLADDPDLKWAYDEAARIAASPPRRAKAARVRQALAHPGLAWGTAAAATIVAIVSLTTSPHGRSPSAAQEPAPSVREVRANDVDARRETLAAAERTAGPGGADAGARTNAASGAGGPSDTEAASGSSGARALSVGSAAMGASTASPSTADPNTNAAASAAGYSAQTFDAPSGSAFENPVVVLPGRVFVDARSVAVMPFGVDAGARPQPSPPARAVASDLYAEVVERLESIPGVYVAQPVSVMPYANTDLDTGEIAAQLGVRGIIEGRVAAADGRVRITLSLTDAASDDVMWRGTIERPADAVADIGVDVVADVAAALTNAGQPAPGATSY